MILKTTSRPLLVIMVATIMTSKEEGGKSTNINAPDHMTKLSHANRFGLLDTMPFQRKIIMMADNIEEDEEVEATWHKQTKRGPTMKMRLSTQRKWTRRHNPKR